MSKAPVPALSTAVLQALPQPIIVCGEDRSIVFVNYAAEAFFGASMIGEPKAIRSSRRWRDRTLIEAPKKASAA